MLGYFEKCLTFLHLDYLFPFLILHVNVLQRELDIVKEEWNTHYIRTSRNSQVSGVPDELFVLPQTQCVENNYLQMKLITFLTTGMSTKKHKLNQEDFELVTYCKYVVANENLMYPPRDGNEARVIYETIIEDARCLNVTDLILLNITTLLTTL